MKRLALLLLLVTMAAAAQGTFEIRDPAAEAYSDTPEEPGAKVQFGSGESGGGMKEGIGATNCDDHLKYRKKNRDKYWSGVVWVEAFLVGASYQQFRTSGESPLTADRTLDSTALWLDIHCRGNPEHDIARAARTFVDEFSALE